MQDDSCSFKTHGNLFAIAVQKESFGSFLEKGCFECFLHFKATSQPACWGNHHPNNISKTSATATSKEGHVRIISHGWDVSISPEREQVTLAWECCPTEEHDGHLADNNEGRGVALHSICIDGFEFTPRLD